jgi:TolB protein
VTVGRGSDNLSPTPSPDGRRIAFTSARTGKPQLWAADVDGGDPELLTPFNYGDQGERTNPNWSPDGRRIAFQSLVRGQYQIMTLMVRDRNARQHTDVGVNEDPAWAPDGRHLAFSSTRGGSQQIWVIDTESGTMRQLTTGGGKTRMAAWSSRLGGTAAP